MVGVGLAVGFGVAVAVGSTGVGVARPPQALRSRQANNKRIGFVRKRFLQGRMQVFYLIFDPA